LPALIPAGSQLSVQKQRIFISGVAGFLGSHLADAFLADGHEVIGNDSMIGGYLDNVPDGVEFYQFDCNDFDKLRPHMKGVDIVYHCAATAYEGLSVFSPHLITQNIVGALINTAPEDAWTWALSVTTPENRINALQMAYMGLNRKNPAIAQQLLQDAHLPAGETAALQRQFGSGNTPFR